MNKITLDAPDRAQLRDLSAQVTQAQTDADAASARLVDARERRTALAGRLGEVRAGRPNLGHDEDVIDALIADPSTAPDADAIARRARAMNEGRHAWEATLAMLEQALAKLDLEIATKQGEVDRLRAAQENAWTSFVRHAYFHLLDQFRTAFNELGSELLDPLSAFRELRSGGRDIINTSTPRIDGRSALAIEHYVDGSRKTDELFPRRLAQEQVLATIQVFRDALSAGSAPNT